MEHSANERNTIRGIVRALDGGQAIVEVEQGGCGRCHEEGGCGGQQLTQMFCSGPKTYRVENTINAEIGDRIVIAIAAGSIQRTANLAYGLPLTAAIAGAMAGMAMAGDVGAMLGCALALAGTFLYLRRYSEAASGNPSERPHIVSRS